MKTFSAFLLFLLLSGLLGAGPLLPRALAQTLSFPARSTGYNVKAYGARGDGTTDDTQAIQAALDADRTVVQDYYGRPKMVYFPAGTYLISNTLTWRGAALSIQGQGQGATVIKLRNAAPGFGNAAQPKPMLQSPDGNMSFRQNVWDLTIDSGTGNPGAQGLDFIANNSGAVRNVTIRSGDGAGVAGLEMTRGWPGPCLIKNLTVQGFDVGVRVAGPEYAPTFENITLSGQRAAGVRNNSNLLNIRRLVSTNAVPAVQNVTDRGAIVLLDSRLEGGAAGTSAIENANGQLYARNVTTAGYQSALKVGATVVPGATLAEYITGPVRELFPSPQASLKLPIEETPDFLDNDTTRWARIVSPTYGDNSRWQAAFDAGKATVYFPAGAYMAWERTYTVPAAVKRIAGFGSVINGGPAGAMTLVVSGNSPDPLIIEQFGYGVRVLHQGSRPVVIRHGGYRYEASPGAGKLYLEDVEMDPLNLVPGQRAWARQFNTEGNNLHVTNNNAQLWILGVKTEGQGTVVRTTGGGKTEVLGGLLYPAQGGLTSAKPAFVNEESSHSLIYGTSNYSGPTGNYPVQVRETRGGVSRDLPLAQLSGRFMPLFVGYQAAPLATAAAAGAAARLGVPYPNPAADAATVQLPYALPVGTPAAELHVYSALGQLLQRLPVPGGRPHGELALPTRQLPAGVYVCSLVADGRRLATQRLVLAP